MTMLQRMCICDDLSGSNRLEYFVTFSDYIEINNEAYRKIGKKWDKNYGTDTLQRDLVDKMKSV